MSPFRVLRTAWMDLLSACAFLVIWIWRDRFEYDTLRALLLWPVVFEMFVALSLFLAGMLSTIRIATVRYLALLSVTTVYLVASWLMGESAGMPQVVLIAAWLLVARVLPPAGLRFGTLAHQQWVILGAGYSALLWGAGFVLTVLCMLVISEPSAPGANGELRSTSPAWIFPLVWTPYFIAEAVLRAWRTPNVAAPRAS